MGELIEMEGCMTPVIVAAPLAIVQVFYCHYAGVPVREAPSVDFPRESVVVFKPDGGLFQETIIATKQLEQLVNAPSPSLTLVQEED
jgi:broad specificity phosphatase PhoE